MKKRIFLTILAAVTVVAACTKFNELKDKSTTGEPSYLYGLLLLSDTQTQNVTNKPLAAKTVYICFSDAYDGLNYLYSTTTDADGYFKFTGLNINKSYLVYYKETAASGAVFTAKSEVLTLPKSKYILQATLAPGQAMVLATIKDPAGNPLKGATVCFGASPIPMNAKVCEGTTYSVTSDELGHAAAFNVAPNTYYALSKITIKDVAYTATATFIVKAGTMTSETFTLNTPPVAPDSTSLSVQLTDINGATFPGGRFCLFTSKVLFARDTCEWSSYSANTDATGKGKLTNLPTQKYYILAELPFRTGKLIARDSFTLTKAPYNLTLRLK